MRFAIASAVVVAASLVTLPAYAGTVSISDGKVGWQSTQCTAPAVPPSIVTANKESHAGDMNALMTQYNGYVALVQSYIDCMSAESQRDADATAAAVAQAGRDKMESVHQSVSGMGTSIQKMNN